MHLPIVPSYPYDYTVISAWLLGPTSTLSTCLGPLGEGPPVRILEDLLDPEEARPVNEFVMNHRCRRTQWKPINVLNTNAKSEILHLIGSSKMSHSQHFQNARFINLTPK